MGVSIPLDDGIVGHELVDGRLHISRSGCSMGRVCKVIAAGVYLSSERGSSFLSNAHLLFSGSLAPPLPLIGVHLSN